MKVDDHAFGGCRGRCHGRNAGGYRGLLTHFIRGQCTHSRGRNVGITWMSGKIRPRNPSNEYLTDAVTGNSERRRRGCDMMP